MIVKYEKYIFVSSFHYFTFSFIEFLISMQGGIARRENTIYLNFR